MLALRRKTTQRRCLLARVGLEEWASNVVRPHEGTLAEAKSDRISLLWALRANTSPILSMFEDKDEVILSLLDDGTGGRPLINIDGKALGFG